MSKIKNISLKSFFSRSQAEFDKVDGILTHIKPVNLFCGKTFSLDVVSYTSVKTIHKLLIEGNSIDHIARAFSLAFGVSEDDFFNAGILEYYQAKNSLIENIKNCIESESELLKATSEVNADWESAGGKRLDVFGTIAPLIVLGKLYGQFPQDVGDRPYNWVLSLLIHNNIESDVMRNYNRIKSNKK